LDARVPNQPGRGSAVLEFTRYLDHLQERTGANSGKKNHNIEVTGNKFTREAQSPIVFGKRNFAHCGRGRSDFRGEVSCRKVARNAP